MNEKRIKYLEVLKKRIDELDIDNYAIGKAKEALNKEINFGLTRELNGMELFRRNLVIDYSRQMNVLDNATVESLKTLLFEMEMEAVRLDSLAKLMNENKGVSNYGYVEGIMGFCEDNIREMKNVILQDCDMLREDINRLIVMELLNLKHYDIDRVFFSETGDGIGRRAIRTVDGFFFVNLNDEAKLVLVQDTECDRAEEMKIDFKEVVKDYKGKNIYIDVKHSIPKTSQPF